jgi:hypothetical protein
MELIWLSSSEVAVLELASIQAFFSLASLSLYFF